MIDVHNFDGKLKGIYNQKIIKNENEKKILFLNFMNNLTNFSAKNALDKIIRDMEIRGQNYHLENDMDCTDLLVDILCNENSKELYEVVEEQLSDMNNLGLCDSGRVTRLFQIWCILYN